MWLPASDRSTDCQLDRLADATEHFYQRIDSERGGFLIHDVGHTRARYHQNLAGFGLLQAMFGNLARQLFHQSLLQRARVIYLFAGRSL
jgi:hypothetical protein